MRGAFQVAAAVIVVVAGAFCIAWYVQASQIRKSVENAIAGLNRQQTYITYDTIETSGFPSEVEVAIVRPHFSGRINELLTSLKAAHPQPGPPLPPWSEDVRLDGRLTLSVNALSSRYRLSMSGNLQQTGTINGQARTSLLQPAGDLSCELQTSPRLLGMLWDFGAPADEGEALADNFRLFDCVNPGYVTTDPVSHARLMSSGPGRIYISHAPQGDNEQLRIYAKSSNSEITPQGNALVTAYMQALSPGYPVPAHFSLYGAQNFELDFSYSGPQKWPNPLGMTPVDMALTRFSLTNNVYRSAASFHLTNGASGTRRAASLALNFTASFGDQYDALLRDIMHGLIYRMYAERQPQMQPWLQQYTPDQMFAILTPAVPDFQALGTLTEALSIRAEGNDTLTAGTVELPVLELSATPYGLTGKGTASLTGSGLPAANVNLLCRGCLRLIDDMAGYEARMQKTVSYFNPQQAAAMALNPQLVDGVKKFLSALAVPGGTPPNAADFAYSIVSGGAAGLSVNGKRADEVMPLFGQYVAPFLRPPAAHPAPAPAPH